MSTSKDPRPNNLVEAIKDHEHDAALFAKRGKDALRGGDIKGAKQNFAAFGAVRQALQKLYEEGVRWLLPGYRK